MEAGEVLHGSSNISGCCVPCSEEDFKAAVRIRDHPWMNLYQRIQQARSAQYDEVRVPPSI